MRIFGAIGRNGSGKDEVIRYLHDRYSITFLSVGDIVRELAREENTLPTRENLDRISEERFARFGKEYFMKLIIQRIEDNRWQKAGISGIRTPSDVYMLRQHFGKSFILLHVDVSDPHLRYERLKRRGEARDPKRYGEFLEQEEKAEELFRLSEAIPLADYSLSNDGMLEELHQQVDQLVREKGLLGSDP